MKSFLSFIIMVIVVAMLCFVHVVLQILIDLLEALQEQLLFFLRHSGGHSLFGLQNVLVARLPHFRASPASVDCAQPKMLSNSLSVRV